MCQCITKASGGAGKFTKGLLPGMTSVMEEDVMDQIENGGNYTFWPCDYYEARDKAAYQNEDVSRWLNDGVECNIEVNESGDDIYYDVCFPSYEQESMTVIMFGESVEVKNIDEDYVRCYNGSDDHPMCCVPITWFKKNFVKNPKEQ